MTAPVSHFPGGHSPSIIRDIREPLIHHVIPTLIYNVSLSTSKYSSMRARIAFQLCYPDTLNRDWGIVGGQLAWASNRAQVGMFIFYAS